MSSEDDLSPESDVDSMEVDITPTREVGGALTPVDGASAVNHDNHIKSTLAGDKTAGGALVPDVVPQFAVSLAVQCVS